MSKILILLGCILSVYSCTDASKDNNLVEKRPFSIHDVKRSLSGLDEIPADSIHVVELKEKGLYITQGFGRVDNMIRLVKLYPDSFVVLDSILTFQEIDVYRQKKITYDLKNNWFISSSISSGTGDLSNTYALVRIEKNHFSELFTYSKNASVIDVEAEDKSHLPYDWVEVKELEMNREKLVLDTEFESGIENSDAPAGLKIRDTVTFEFSKSLNKFVLKSPMDPILKKKFWMDKKGEYLFRI